MKLAFIDNRINAKGYQHLLSSKSLSFGESIGGPEWVFQQDNAPIHKAGSTLDFLRTHGIQVLDWPACSPDLNPMENVWRLLVKLIYNNVRQYRSVQDLKTAIMEACDKIEPVVLQKLIDSMRTRLLEVVKVRGRSIDY